MRKVENRDRKVKKNRSQVSVQGPSYFWASHISQSYLAANGKREIFH